MVKEFSNHFHPGPLRFQKPLGARAHDSFCFGFLQAAAGSAMSQHTQHRAAPEHGMPSCNLALGKLAMHMHMIHAYIGH